MSKSTNPIATMLEMQRRSIEQTREAIHRSFDLGKQANEIAVEGVESSRSIQERGNELVRNLAEAYTSALDQSVPGDTAAFRDLQRVFEDQLEAIEEVNQQTWEALDEMLEENTRAFEEFTQEYLEMVDESTEEILSALERVGRSEEPEPESAAE